MNKLNTIGVDLAKHVIQISVVSPSNVIPFIIHET